MINSKFSSCSETQSGGDEEFSFHATAAPLPALGHRSAFGFNRARMGLEAQSTELHPQTCKHSRSGSYSLPGSARFGSVPRG